MKNELRKKLASIRHNIPEKREKSIRILNNLVSLPVYISSRSVMVYISFGDEVDTRIFIEKMLKDGKILSAPLCTGDGIMEARQFSSFSDLEEGKFGILAPKGKSIACPDLILVPGLGFSRNFFRIGYGGGYYDRFLKDKRSTSCGIFFDEQFVDFVPDSHDVALDYIITEKKILKRE